MPEKTYILTIKGEANMRALIAALYGSNATRELIKLIETQWHQQRG